MRLPRDLNAEKLIKLMKNLGYVIKRQTGSHIRLSAITKKGEHNITIPNHNPIKIGMLSAIIKEICKNNEISESDFLNEIMKN